MTIFTYANEATALVAILLMALVARGYAPYLFAASDQPEMRFRAGIALAGIVVSARLTYWDVAVQLVASWSTGVASIQAIHGQVANSLFNFGTIFAAWLWLSALHLSLPERDRPHYNWLTAPFYPRRFWRRDGGLR